MGYASDLRDGEWSIVGPRSAGDRGGVQQRPCEGAGHIAADGHSDLIVMAEPGRALVRQNHGRLSPSRLFQKRC